jgi:quinol monooxygenase YgiN
VLALVVRFQVAPGSAAAFDALVAATVPRIRADEPGTLTYAVHTVEDDPDARVFYEVYSDRAAFEAHETYPHTRRMLDEMRAYLAAEPRVEFLIPVD